MKEILLLHGAIGAMDQLQELETKLAGSYKVHRLNFGGHGGMPLTSAGFSIRNFAEEVINFLNTNKIEVISAFGYSMGGYVGMYLAKNYPHRIHKLITLATKFIWDESIASKEVSMLNAGKIEEKLPGFANILKKRHAPNDWKTVLENTASMLLKMGTTNPLLPDDYSQIHHHILLMIGDKDKMVTLDETIAVFKKLPHAQLAVLPNSAHPIELINLDRLANELKLFLM